MKEKPEFPEQFTLMNIQYKNGCKGLAYSKELNDDDNFGPQCEVGDEVITTFDEGTISGMVKYCTPEDEWFKLISQVMTVDRITHKIVEVKQ